MMFRLISAAMLTVLCVSIASAQDAGHDTISVTASRMDSEDLASMPNVSIKVPADFIQFGITCQSATRDTSARRKELEAQFVRLVAWAKDTTGYGLSGGQPGVETIPLDTISFHEITRTSYGDRLLFSLVLAADVRKGETFDGVKLRVEDDTDKLDATGRVECFLQDDQFLGVRNIDAHRKVLLNRIAAEVKDMKAIFGKSSVTVTGLESRVVSQPSGALVLDVFIPYEMTLETD